MATIKQPPAQEENFFQKERRLKKRKPVYTESYKKGCFHQRPDVLSEYLKQPDIIVRVNKGGKLDDGTEFIQITIEGIKP